MATSRTTAEPRDGRPCATAIGDGTDQGHYRLSHLDASRRRRSTYFGRWRPSRASCAPVLGGKDSIVMLHLTPGIHRYRLDL